MNEQDEKLSLTTDTDDGSTVLFGSVSAGNAARASSASPLNDGNGNNHEKRDKALRILGKTGKYSGKTVLFILRKALTYTLNVLLTVLIICTLVGAVVALAFMVYLRSFVSVDYDGLDNLKYDSSLTTSLYYTDEYGNEIELPDDRLSSSQNRLWVAYSDIPSQLINAYVSIEDQRFWEHNGVDTKRTLSAVYNFFIPSGSRYGGSTITQQLIKNVSGDNQDTIQRKILEIFRALNVEKKYDKTEILEMYLNTIYLSQNCYGVRAAAEKYFGKELSELTLTECASLASIGRWPINYDPMVNPQNNLERRNLVLREMLSQGVISSEEYYDAYDAPLALTQDDNHSYSEYVHSYYIDAVIDDVIDDLMETYGMDEKQASIKLYSGGLHIVTCVDPTIQSIMEEVFTNESYWPEISGMQAQAAMCIVDPATGNLLGIVGGRGEKKISRGLNRATQSRRQCGSSIKPLSVYALALERGVLNFCGPCDDVPILYDEEAEAMWPNNSWTRWDGTTSLINAVQRSMNTVAVKTCELLGVDAVFENLRKSGLSTLVDSYTNAAGVTFSDRALSPLSLGSFTWGVTVRDMAQAYCAFANGGVAVQARTYSVVRDSMGNIVLDNRPEEAVLYSEETAFMMTKLLEAVVSGSVGTARNYITIQKEFEGLEVAAKTGTTNDNKDLYFCGYTPDFVGACWFGYDNNKTITAKGSPSAVLWNYIFQKLYRYYEENGIYYTKKFEMPGSVAYAGDTGLRICSYSGKLATEACEHDIAYYGTSGSCVTTDFYYLKSEAPTEYCDRHVLVEWDKQTKSICVPGCNCPEDNLVRVGFRLAKKSDRCFRKNIVITDAQYIYIDVPVGYEYPDSTSVAFFQNLYDATDPEHAEYPGRTSGADRPANSYCKEHYHAFPLPDPDPDPEPDPDPDPIYVPDPIPIPDVPM